MRSFGGVVLMVLAATGCAARDADAQTDAVNLGGVTFSLRAQEGRCAVQSRDAAGDTLRSLAVPWPCQFHRNKHGDVRVREEGGFRYMLIEAVEPRSPENATCITQLQSLRTGRNGLEISPKTDRVASCPPFQWDAFVFSALF